MASKYTYSTAEEWCEGLYQEILSMNGGDKKEAEEFRKMFLGKGELKMNQTPEQIASLLIRLLS